MATRSRESFKKRQKELLRVVKARDKAAKRLERKSAKELGVAVGPDSDVESPQEDGDPTEPAVA